MFKVTFADGTTFDHRTGTWNEMPDEGIVCLQVGEHVLSGYEQYYFSWEAVALVGGPGRVVGAVAGGIRDGRCQELRLGLDGRACMRTYPRKDFLMCRDILRRGRDA